MNKAEIDIYHLKDIYTQARNRYKPAQIMTLIIAEAPPCALDRFFYFEDVKKQDSLFLEIMGVLYPKQKEQYLASGRKSLLKTELLEQFSSDGYWMMDVCDIPTSIIDGPTLEDAEKLVAGLEGLITRDTPVILIKANVFDLCYNLLKANHYQVINERLPFPGSGQQKVFREKFRDALNSNAY